MRTVLSIIAIVCFSIGFLAIVMMKEIPTQQSSERREPEDHAMEMFEWWYGQRALPYDAIPVGAFQKAAAYSSTKMQKEQTLSGIQTAYSQWTSIGPVNVAGRILSLAVDPVNTNIVWAGSASGGLWKSTTGGVGASAWTFVNTGFSSLAVSTITIDPSHTDTMYIGTGEISFYQAGMVGTPAARSSYGIGILKTTDGGSTWTQTGLSFAISQVTAIEKIVINPLNPNTLFAATSEGVYKSTDAGASWTANFTDHLSMDMVMDPTDTNVVYMASGNLNSSANSGMYRTSNNGLSWFRLSTIGSGLPTTNFGRTSLAISPGDPTRIFAGIVNASTSQLYGLYVSTNNGQLWTKKIGTYNVNGQGWYDNIIAVNPHTPDTLFGSGLDTYRSIDGGDSLEQRSFWYEGFFGTITPGGAEGSDEYIHADHHAIAFDPINTSTVYFGTDGGVFKTTNGGQTFFGCNGGLVTSQFYNGFSSALSDSSIALGGLQDNGVLKYSGLSAWSKVDDGDGGWAAIDPTNTNILYDEYVYLTLSKSTNGGSSFFGIYGSGHGLPTGPSEANFIAPFAIAPSSPNILYAGGKNVYKTTNGGAHWAPTNDSVPLNGNKIACISVSWTSSDTLIAATGQSSTNPPPLFQVFRSTNGGTSWSNVTASLPNRYPTDISFDPVNSTVVYLSYSGYGAGHVFRSSDAGTTWSDVTSNLPDIPHQSVVVDPDAPSNVYVGTDLGVYHSSNSGSTWEEFNTGMNTSMVCDLAISPTNQVLRAATFGNGVYQRRLYHTPELTLTTLTGGEVIASGTTENIVWKERFLSAVRLEYSTNAGASWNIIADNVTAASQSYAWDIPAIATTHARIRISDAMTADAIDSSGSSFTILVNPDVYAGWNLLSLRLAVPDARTTTVFPLATSSAFAYASGYVKRDTLRNGVGYWVKFATPQFDTYTGDSLSIETVYVKSGWNMIGTLTQPMASSAVIELPPGIVRSPYFGYQSGYTAADSLIPHRGYWVKILQDGKLVLNEAQASEKRTLTGTSASERAQLSSFNSLTLTDAKGYRQTLYFARGELSSMQYEMPPPPPDNTFDVRFTSQQMVECDSRNERTSSHTIAFHGASYPIQIHWRIIEDVIDRISIALSADTHILTGEEGSLILTDQSTSRMNLHIEYSATSITPKAYTLYQNYPNPFNPSTELKFDIPEREVVSLKVFDILGQEMATLVNEIKEAGSYTITFDGLPLPSGIYFYRLQAGTFTDIKKMLLIK